MRGWFGGGGRGGGPWGPSGGQPWSRPPTDEDDETYGAIRSSLGGISRVARTGMGIVAGIGLYQNLTRAMELYEQRARGIIGIGMQLNLNFDEVGQTIDSLRGKYHILARDSLAGMQAMGRITGGFTGFSQAALIGTAFGIPVQEAAGQAALLQRITVPGVNPLATLLGTARQIGERGYEPMPPATLLQEPLAMAQMGAQFGGRVPVEFYGQMAGLIGGMGEQFQVPGAISQFYGQLAGGLNQAPDVGVHAIRMQSLAGLRDRRIAAGQSPVLNIGGIRYDLRNVFDMEAAAEVAGQSPEIMQSYQDTINQMIGGREELRSRAEFEILGGRKVPRPRILQMEQAGLFAPGRFGALGRPATIAADVETEAEGRLAIRRERPEFGPQRTEAEIQTGFERMGEPLVRMANELQLTMARTADSFRDGAIQLDKLNEALKTMSKDTQAVLGTLMMLSGNPAEMVLGGVMAGGAAASSMPSIYRWMLGIFGSGWSPNGQSAMPVLPTMPGP